MLIQMLTTACGPRLPAKDGGHAGPSAPGVVNAKAGETVDVDPKLAKELIDGGYAVRAKE